MAIKIHLEDNYRCKIYHYLEPVADLINEYLKKGYNVIVHCKTGISISATFIMTYLIKYHNRCYNSAFTFLQQKRSVVDPNIGFIHELHNFYDYQLWRVTIMIKLILF